MYLHLETDFTLTLPKNRRFLMPMQQKTFKKQCDTGKNKLMFSTIPTSFIEI